MSRPRPLGIIPAPVPQGFPGRATFIKSAAKFSQTPHLPQPEVCFCGRSNVGKSSLINTLTNRRQLARVSGTPGRTRLINFFDIQSRVTFVDLPGYGWAKVPKDMQAHWGRTIRGYLEDRQQLALALLLVDMRRDPGDDERSLLQWFTQQGRSCLIVATKADKVPTTRQKARVRAIAGSLEVATRDIIAFSALTRQGRDLIWGTILSLVADRGSAPGQVDGARDEK